MNTNLLLFSKIGFALLTAIFVWLLLRLLKKGIDQSALADHSKKKTFNSTIAGLLLWLVFVSVWSLSGIMGDFTRFPFNFIPVIAIPLVIVVAVLFTNKLTSILLHVSHADIMQLQGFRFFVELLLWALFAAGVLPEQMTFEGRNFDILVGITAPVIAWLAIRNKISRIGLIIWNFAGLALLINIVTIAILSTPSPIRIFMNEPANTIVTLFPVSWLPGFLVPLAYTLHLFSLKKLFSQKA